MSSLLQLGVFELGDTYNMQGSSSPGAALVTTGLNDLNNLLMYTISWLKNKLVNEAKLANYRGSFTHVKEYGEVRRVAITLQK